MSSIIIVTGRVTADPVMQQNCSGDKSAIRLPTNYRLHFQMQHGNSRSRHP